MKLFTLSENADALDIVGVVNQYFQKIGHSCSFDEMMNEANQIYNGFRQIRINKKVDRICNELQCQGLSYIYLPISEKAKLFAFRMDDNNYNLAIHSAVLNKLGVRMDFDERYEDYQKVYEASLEKQKKDISKDRGR